MKWGIALAALIAATVTAFGLARSSGPETAVASSHREAPLIAEDPIADNTDVYAFVSPDRPDTVTILANYIPLEEPAGGPNFNAFGENVLYELKIDNTGDGAEDISYQFRFRTKTRNPDTFLYNTGPIDTLSDTDWNRPQFYSVTRVDGRHGKRSTVLAENLRTPPVNIGPRSTPSYGSLMSAAVNSLPGGGKVYAGQIDDPFYVDLGSVFDLAGLRPFNPAHDIALPAENGVDGVGGYNTHTIALQVPIAQLTKDQAIPTGPNDPDAVIGVYASSSRQRIQVLGKDGDLKSHGAFVQVSRLANPLINEVVIPLGQKDAWNLSDPSGDAEFLEEYLDPEVTRLEDDVTDIELRAFACGYGTVVGPVVEALGECGGNANRSPNNLLGDGVDENDRPLHVGFPYAAEPHQGYEHVHHSSIGGP